MENFPNMGKEIITQVQETQRVPYMVNARRNTPRHILNKLTKIKFKEKVLKAARGRQNNIQRNPLKVTFSRNSAGRKGVAGFI